MVYYFEFFSSAFYILHFSLSIEKERQKEDAIAGAEENFPIANSGDVMLNENLWVNSE
jgi:hypothetical protein